MASNFLHVSTSDLSLFVQMKSKKDREKKFVYNSIAVDYKPVDRFELAQKLFLFVDNVLHLNVCCCVRLCLFVCLFVIKAFKLATIYIYTQINK